MEYNKFKSFYRQLLNNIFKFFLNLIPIRKLRAKLKAAWTKFYIKKYALIALDNYDESKIKFNKSDNLVIFQYWEQGIENAPDIIKACVSSIDVFEPDSGHIILNNKNLENYVEIPSFIYDLKNKGKIKLPQFSDIVRSYLLASYPCVWADSSILLTDKFPKYITDNDFFVFKGNNITPTPEKFACANFFIYSKKPNSILIQVKDAITEYWKDNDFLISYFTHPHFLSLISNINEENKKLFDKIPYKNEILTLRISNLLFEKYNKEKFDKLKAECTVHKCTYKIPDNLKTGIDNTLFGKIIEEYGRKV